MKYTSGLLLLIIMCTSCKEHTSTNSPKENAGSEDNANGTGNKKRYHTQYIYADPFGKRVIIQNSYPKSKIHYTDPEGEKYTYIIFWTRIINETSDELTMTINSPADSFELSQGRFTKLLIPSDTMTSEEESQADYGLNARSFLDNYRHKSTSLKRTVSSGDSSAFYVVALSSGKSKVVARGALRSGLSLREQDLVYTISNYTATPPTLSLTAEKEISIGSINLKNLRLQK